MTLGFFDGRKVKKESQSHIFDWGCFWSISTFHHLALKKWSCKILQTSPAWDILISSASCQWATFLIIILTLMFFFLCQAPGPLNSPHSCRSRSMALQLNLTYLFIDWVCSKELFEVAFCLTIDYPCPPPTLFLLPLQLLHICSWQAHLPSFLHSPLLPFTLPVLSAWQRKWKGVTIRRPIRWVNTHSPSLW